jgi:hypothetical protein
MTIDVSDVVDSIEFTQAVTVNRVAPGSYVDGLWVDGANSATAISAAVQPLSDRDRQALPEGIRTMELLKLYTTFQLRTADEKAGLSADDIVFQGDTYKVVALTNWTSNGYVRAYVERLK